MRGVSGDVDDGDVMKRRVDVVGGEQVRRVVAIERDQLQVIAGRREHAILRHARTHATSHQSINQSNR